MELIIPSNRFHLACMWIKSPMPIFLLACIYKEDTPLTLHWAGFFGAQSCNRLGKPGGATSNSMQLIFHDNTREDGERNTLLHLGLLRNFSWRLYKLNPNETPFKDMNSLPILPHTMTTSGLLGQN